MVGCEKARAEDRFGMGEEDRRCGGSEGNEMAVNGGTVVGNRDFGKNGGAGCGSGTGNVG